MQHDSFQSPFAWRYGSDAMRRIWGEVNKRRLWRRLWLALAQAEQQAGLVSQTQIDDLAAHVDDVDVERAEAIEAVIHHDLMAEVQAYAEQCTVGGAIIHLGATSADIEDNADALRIRDSFDLIIPALRSLLLEFASQIEHLAEAPTMAFTHLQPAEPTTMGYRLCLYAQDLLTDYEALRNVRNGLRGKGLKGAVGTGASYAELLAGTPITPAELERQVMDAIGLTPYPIASQTYPRKQDWAVVSGLAGLAGSLYKFAFDLRVLQSPVIGEWSEPFAAQQVGSSAMPFKRNPINAEKIDSLARLVKSFVDVAWDNAAHSLLERTLDDSANRREMLPVAFLASDEMLRVTSRIVRDLRIDKSAAARIFARFGAFAAVERVLMAASKRGADRQALHEHLREQSLTAWSALAEGAPNPLFDNLRASDTLRPYLSPDEVTALLDAGAYVGDAPERARQFASHIRSTLPET